MFVRQFNSCVQVKTISFIKSCCSDVSFFILFQHKISFYCVDLTKYLRVKFSVSSARMIHLVLFNPLSINVNNLMRTFSPLEQKRISEGYCIIYYTYHVLRIIYALYNKKIYVYKNLLDIFSSLFKIQPWNFFNEQISKSFINFLRNTRHGISEGHRITIYVLRIYARNT